MTWSTSKTFIKFWGTCFKFWLRSCRSNSANIVGYLEFEDVLNADGGESMFVLMILGNFEKQRAKISSRNGNSFIKDGKLWKSKS